ncbi:hypothetical protein RN001_003368 [Aquatica leii]|uniref:4-coumarate--CoA ligase n=1 Tax=Aquatica leii TaxID=1421715 RepID=A0AAN7PI77_9COLE|nr:hypothetical protein RN001_003368 [Aquatica leii]
MLSVIKKCGKITCYAKKLKNYAALIRRNKSDFLSSSYPTIEIPNVIVPEFVFESFDKYPNKVAVECDFTGKKYTFDEIRLKSRNLNTNLRKKLNLKKGDVIAIILPNVADYPICVFGALQAGLVVTTINPSYKSGEISRQLLDCNAKAIVTLSSLYNTVQEILTDAKISIPILTVKTKISSTTPSGAIDLNEFSQTKQDVSDTVEIHPKDVALLLYSSGTTGLSKGVQHTHQSIVANICQTNTEEFKFYPDRSETYENKVLSILPWFHIYGIVAILFNQLRLLTKLICIQKFTPESFIDMLIKHKPTCLHLVPQLILFITNNPLIKSEFLQPVSTVIYGSAPLSETNINAFLNKINRKINLVNGYGLTETIAVCYTSKTSIAKGYFGTMGLFANTSLKIVSPENCNLSLGVNQKGEILVKGPQVMKCYHNRETETKNAFVDGWYITGDLGYYDEKGFVYITDRLKNIIKVNSFQVAPTELEDIIRGFKDVEDTAVIGIPDEQYGEVPLAFVVPVPNKKLNINDLQKYVSTKVVKYKQLKGGVIVVDSLPKNATGKILRNDLLIMYKNQML